MCCNRPLGPPPAGQFGRGPFWPVMKWREARYGYRGTIVGEASHPGPLNIETDYEPDDQGEFFDILEEAFSGEPTGLDLAALGSAAVSGLTAVLGVPAALGPAALTPVYVDIPRCMNRNLKTNRCIHARL